MLEYLQQYNNLPEKLRNDLSAPGIVTAIHNLEAKYKISLALVVMKAAIGEFKSDNLAAGLMNDCKLSAEAAANLAKDLLQSIFFVLPNFQSSAVVATKPASAAQTSPVVAAAPVAKDNSAIDVRVEDLIKKAKIDLASQSLIDRLKQVMRTYLLGVRDKLAVKDALTRPIELGGLAFSTGLADELIKIADGKGSALGDNAIRPTRPSLPVNLGMDSDQGYDLLGSLKAKGEAKAEMNPLAVPSRLAQQQSGVVKAQPAPANLPWSGSTLSVGSLPNSQVIKASPIVKLVPKSESLKSKVESLEAKSAVVVATKVEKKETLVEKKPLPAPAKPVVLNPQVTVIKELPKAPVAKAVEAQYNKTESGAIKMDDVSFTPRVFTPIDELKYMTIKNFRNLSANPLEATELIKHKLESLAKDDFSWKLEGISAWKQCPVNKMYVDIYHTAMSEGKQIGQVIEAKQKADKEALTSAEFEAIFSFNQEISLYK